MTDIVIKSKPERPIVVETEGPGQAVTVTERLGRPGQGVPAGGAVGEFLRKSGTGDYSTEWAAVTATADWSTITGKPTFATVATSGAYSDLTGLPTLFSGAWADLTGKPATFPPEAHTHSDATTSVAGFMSTADKTKLDGLATVATSGSAADLSGTLAAARLPAFTGAVTTSAGSSATSLGSFTKAQLDAAVSDGNVLYVGDVTSNATHTGDATGATALTLATVNSNVGSFGSATQVATFTVNGKGLTTAAASVSISIPSTQVNDFASASRAQTEAELVAGTNITITPSGTGATRQLTIAASGGGGVSDGDKGDIVVSGGGTAWAIDSAVWTGARTIAGNWTFGDGSGPTDLLINAATANIASLYFRKGGVNRWRILANNATESGGNAGANFSLNAHDDAGAFLGTVLSVIRSTQVVDFSQTPTVGGVPIGGGSSVNPLRGWLV